MVFLRHDGHSLRERQRDAQRMIASQCDARIRAVRDELDQRIRGDAKRMARTARSAFVNTNGLSLIGVAPWLVQGSDPPLPYELIRTHPPVLVLIEDDLGEPGHEHPQVLSSDVSSERAAEPAAPRRWGTNGLR